MAGTSRDSWELREESGSLVVEGAEDYGEQLDIKMLLHNEVAGIVPLQLRYVFGSWQDFAFRVVRKKQTKLYDGISVVQ